MLKHILVWGAISAASSGLWGQDSSPTSDQLKQYLEISSHLGQLEEVGAPPFALKASFEVFEGGGNSPERGTVELLWKDFSHFRTVMTFSGKTLVENDDGTTHWRTGEWSVAAQLALAEDAALKPLIQVDNSTDRLSESGEDNGSLKLDCIASEPRLPGIADDAKVAQTTYCLEPGNHMLRLVKRPNDWAIAFNDEESFENKYIPRTIDVSNRGKALARLHIDSLARSEDFSALNTAPPNGAQVLKFHSADGRYISGEVMHGQVIEAIQPVLPADAPHGNVILKLHVDTTGHVASAEVVSSPSPLLTAASLSAAKQWRFRLSYRGTQGAVGVDETVVFRF
jgi:TonB family protein